MMPYYKETIYVRELTFLEKIGKIVMSLLFVVFSPILLLVIAFDYYLEYKAMKGIKKFRYDENNEIIS